LVIESSIAEIIVSVDGKVDLQNYHHGTGILVLG
jgi:hypothetical protein